MDDKPSAAVFAVPAGVVSSGLAAFIQGQWNLLAIAIGVGVAILVLLVMVAVRNA